MDEPSEGNEKNFKRRQGALFLTLTVPLRNSMHMYETGILSSTPKNLYQINFDMIFRRMLIYIRHLSRSDFFAARLEIYYIDIKNNLYYNKILHA